MGVSICVVDAFTNRPFAGNPAAVCVLNSWLEEDWLQAVASEMNLSETAYLVPQPDNRWCLRWFTPVKEVSLCGHATLAAAHRLWESELLPPDREAVFETAGGTLTCRRNGDWIHMDFPAMESKPTPPEAGLEKALGVSRIVNLEVNSRDIIAEVASEVEVRAAVPDFRSLSGDFSRSDFILTARADDSEFDFVSRFFAPADGIDEDPVTGSAHCGLAPYWAKRLNKRDMVGHQVSARGGRVHVSMQGERVELGGQAVTVWEGELGGRTG